MTITREAIAEALARARRRHLDAVTTATEALQAAESALRRMCGEQPGHVWGRIDAGGAVQPTACLACGQPAEHDGVSTRDAYAIARSARAVENAR